jgi:hydrogenase nickel incorporation protein HypA/HybF
MNNVTFGNSNLFQMHEFSIAMDIVDIATVAAREEEATVVKEIEVEIGQLSGVVMEALEFSLEAAVKGTVLETARRNLVIIPGRARCTKCYHEYDTDTFFKPCPECGACAPDIVRGRELRVKSLLVE